MEKKEEKERRGLLARKAGFLSAARGTGGELGSNQRAAAQRQAATAGGAGAL